MHVFDEDIFVNTENVRRKVIKDTSSDAAYEVIRDCHRCGKILFDRSFSEDTGEWRVLVMLHEEGFWIIEMHNGAYTHCSVMR